MRARFCMVRAGARILLNFVVAVEIGPLNLCFNAVLITYYFLDIPFTNEAMKNSRKICVNKIGKGIWLEDLPTHFQDKVSHHKV
jgi:hypothetical protein